MQFVVLLIIILILSMILSDSIIPMIILIGLLTLFSLMCELFFIVSAIMSLFTRKVEAEFVDFEDNEKYGMHAVYSIDGEEYDNMFPADSLMKKILYKNKQTSVRMLKLGKRRYVFDKPSQVTIVMGLMLFTAASAILIWFLSQMFLV